MAWDVGRPLTLRALGAIGTLRWDKTSAGPCAGDLSYSALDAMGATARRRHDPQAGVDRWKAEQKSMGTGPLRGGASHGRALPCSLELYRADSRQGGPSLGEVGVSGVALARVTCCRAESPRLSPHRARGQMRGGAHKRKRKEHNKAKEAKERHARRAGHTGATQRAGGDRRENQRGGRRRSQGSAHEIPPSSSCDVNWRQRGAGDGPRRCEDDTQASAPLSTVGRWPQGSARLRR